MFGGFDGRFYQLGTWQWTGRYWMQLHPATSPTARSEGPIGTETYGDTWAL
jgi:hypothetical protein